MSQENSAKAAAEAVNKETMLKLVEDPYFQYLVEKKARSQTRTYLVLVGSAILAILAYGGWEFKSAKDEIEKQKTAIQAAQKEVRETADDVKLTKEAASMAAAEVQSTATGVQATVSDAERLTLSSKEFAAQSVGLANSMLTTARENMTTSQHAQAGLLEQQNRVINSVSQVNAAAAHQLELAQAQLAKVEHLYDSAGSKVDETERRVNEVLGQTGRIDDVEKRLGGLTANATRLNTIQDRLLQGGIVATVLMRSRVPATIKLLDPEHPDSHEYDWTITFTGFNLDSQKMHVWGEARREIDSRLLKFEVKGMNAAPTEGGHKPYSLRDFGIPFKIQVDFAYHTLLSRDFASLKVIGDAPSKARPAGHTTATAAAGK